MHTPRPSHTYLQAACDAGEVEVAGSTATIEPRKGPRVRAPRPAGPAAPEGTSSSIYIRALEPGVTREDVQGLFTPYGTVIRYLDLLLLSALVRMIDHSYSDAHHSCVSAACVSFYNSAQIRHSPNGRSFAFVQFEVSRCYCGSYKYALYAAATGACLCQLWESMCTALFV
jgi:hypothetical protein